MAKSSAAGAHLRVVGEPEALEGAVEQLQLRVASFATFLGHVLAERASMSDGDFDVVLCHYLAMVQRWGSALLAVHRRAS